MVSLVNQAQEPVQWVLLVQRVQLVSQEARDSPGHKDLLAVAFLGLLEELVRLDSLAHQAQQVPLGYQATTVILGLLDPREIMAT